MNSVKRFFKRNCIRISFYILLFALFGFASHLDRPIPDQTEKVPVMTVRTMEAELATKYLPSVQEMIKTSCEEHGIDHDIPLAIAQLETGHFTSDAFLYGNNVGGISKNEVPLTYKTVEDGVEHFVSNLSKNYFGKGLNTPEQISRKYCPANAEAWAESVRLLMEEA